MDNIDKLIESEGDKFIDCSGHWLIRCKYGVYFIDQRLGDYICTVGEYKDRINQKNGCYGDGKRGGVVGGVADKQELIKLIKSIDSDDATSIANVILRNGWVKK